MKHALMLLLKLRDFFCSPVFHGSIACLGGTIGAAGWILGASWQLERAGLRPIAIDVLWCAAGVLLVGGVMWCLWLIQRKINVFALIQVLLGASCVFGVAALGIMGNQGVVAFAVDASGQYSEAFAYAAPAALLAIMACLWLPPIRKGMQKSVMM